MGAITDRMAMRYLREDAIKVPGSKPLKTLGITSESLTTQLDFTESETVIGDRQLQDTVKVAERVQGSIEFELLYGNIDDLLEGALANDWEGSPVANVLENGDEDISFAFEKDFGDIGVLAQFLGCKIDTFGMTFPLREKITGSMSVLGSQGQFASGSASIGTGSPVAAVQLPPMVTLASLAISEGGSSPALDYLTEFSFELNNNTRELPRLGSIDLRGLALGLNRVEGSVTAYFEDTRLAEMLLAETESDWEITTADSEGNSYTWVFPRFKFTSIDGPNQTGRSQDVFLTLGWTALRDPSTGITMRVERDDAP